jgi:hypothetical protein
MLCLKLFDIRLETSGVGDSGWFYSISVSAGWNDCPRPLPLFSAFLLILLLLQTTTSLGNSV